MEPIQCGYIEHLEVGQDVDPKRWSGLNLILRLRSTEATGSACVRMEFDLVRELRLGPIDGLSVHCIEFESIMDWQLEGMNYQVKDVEHDAISFCCRSFSIIPEGLS